ncbi:acyltransferase [Sphingomonas sp. PB2P12]|uniref:acyltransferase family protein n=1 Tax=Sphingomonas sandaracina TaxID=3096157 RepID=UPI002FC6C221
MAGGGSIIITYINIQALRAIAALIVVWAHVRELFPDLAIIKYLPSGLAGVDLFFVISGFIMVVSTQSRAIGPLEFLANRWGRLAPIYYIVTIFVFLLAAFAPAIMKSSRPDADSLLYSLLFIPHLKSADRIYPLYYLGWTLNYEMFFYATLALGMRIFRTWRYVATAVFICALAALGFAMDDLFDESIVLYAFTRSITLDFVLGIAIALSIPALTRIGHNRVLAGLALVLGLVALAVAGRFVPHFDERLIAPAGDTILRYGIPAALIVASAVALELNGAIIKNRLVLLIGDASYSLYLTHFFVIAVAIMASNRLGLGTPARIGVAVAAYAASIAVAIGFYKMVEQSLNRIVRARLRALFHRDTHRRHDPPAGVVDVTV